MSGAVQLVRMVCNVLRYKPSEGRNFAKADFSGFFHFFELGGGFFPVGGGEGELVDDAAEFAIEMLGLAGSGISFRSLEFGGEFCLLGFERGDGFFQLADLFAEFTDFVRRGFFRG